MIYQSQRQILASRYKDKYKDNAVLQVQIPAKSKKKPQNQKKTPPSN